MNMAKLRGSKNNILNYILEILMIIENEADEEIRKSYIKALKKYIENERKNIKN